MLHMRYEDIILNAYRAHEASKTVQKHKHSI